MLLLNSSSVHTVYIWSSSSQLLTKIHEDHNPVLLTQIPGGQTLTLLLLLQKRVRSDETPTASGEQAVGAANLLEIKHCTLLCMILELWWFMMYVLQCWTSEAVSPVYHCIELCLVFKECCSLAALTSGVAVTAWDPRASGFLQDLSILRMLLYANLECPARLLSRLVSLSPAELYTPHSYACENIWLHYFWTAHCNSSHHTNRSYCRT